MGDRERDSSIRVVKGNTLLRVTILPVCTYVKRVSRRRGIKMVLTLAF